MIYNEFFIFYFFFVVIFFLLFIKNLIVSFIHILFEYILYIYTISGFLFYVKKFFLELNCM